MVNAIVFALISYLGWGIGDVFGTRATRKIGGYSTTFWYVVFQLIIFSFFSFFFINLLGNLTLGIFILNLILGVIGLIGLITFYEGLRVGNASLVGTISSSFAAITVVLSIIFLKERINIIQTISIITIFLGIVISGLDFKELRNKKLFAGKGVYLAIITAVLFGIYWTFIKIPVEEIGWYWPGIISMTTFPTILLFMRLRNLKLSNPTEKKSLIPLVLGSILVGTGTFSFNFAISRGLTAIVAPIAGSYSTLFAILAYFVFKDPITKREIFGIIITLTGIVLLSFFSV